MKQAPAGCDQCQRYPARQFPDTIVTAYGADDMQPKVIRCRPLSLVARMALWLQRWL